jgi:hypothetical protein
MDYATILDYLVPQVHHNVYRWRHDYFHKNVLFGRPHQQCVWRPETIGIRMASEWHPNVDLVKGHISLHKLRKASREVHGRPFRKHLVPVFRTNLMSNERVRSDSGGLNI